MGKRLVYAHRGGAALAPENTIPAFDAGLKAGADGLEFDVRLSRDGVPVLHHDPTLDRTTNARGPLAALTADELAHVDAGNGAGVPRLEEVLRRYPDPHLIVELKDDTREIAEAVVAVLRKTGSVERAIVSSFHTRPILAARAALPGLRTGATSAESQLALACSWIGLSPIRPAYCGFQIPEKRGRMRVVSPRFVQAVRRKGLEIAVWTVNEEADMRRLLEWGVTGLITDRPDLAVPLVR